MPIESQQELAQERTVWAKQRTLLAKQRTFSAWLRTGLSSMAVGLAVVKLLGEVEPRWLPGAMGILLILVSALIQVHGFQGYYQAYRQLNREGIEEHPVWLLGLIAGGMLVSTLLALVLVLVEPHGLDPYVSPSISP
jgi:putative membrane protein